MKRINKMKEYEILDKYLKVSRTFREFCSDRETMMFEVLKMDISEDGKIHWIESIGNEIDRVLSFIGRLESERKSHLNLNK